MKAKINFIRPAARRLLDSILLCLFFIAAMPLSVNAENVFLKDGSILADVKMVSESADSVTVTMSKKSKKKILRKDILRVNNIELNSRKSFIFKRKNTSRERVMIFALTLWIKMNPSIHSGMSCTGLKNSSLKKPTYCS